MAREPARSAEGAAREDDGSAKTAGDRLSRIAAPAIVLRLDWQAGGRPTLLLGYRDGAGFEADRARGANCRRQW